MLCQGRACWGMTKHATICQGMQEDRLNLPSLCIYSSLGQDAVSQFFSRPEQGRASSGLLTSQRTFAFNYSTAPTFCPGSELKWSREAWLCSESLGRKGSAEMSFMPDKDGVSAYTILTQAGTDVACFKDELLGIKGHTYSPVEA